MPQIFKIEKNVPLAPLTTFKIGGPARYFIEAKTEEDLLNAAGWAKEKHIPFFILGGGSNLLVADAGVDGLVVKLANEALAFRGSRLEAGAGAHLGRAASLAADRGLSGLEWSVGIPRATFGGAIRGNAEAFGSPLGELVETAKVYDSRSGRFLVMSRKDCGFGYRDSAFKRNENLIVWQAILKLNPASRKEIEKLTRRSFDFRSNNYPRLPSAGSIFKNIPPGYIAARNPAFFEDLKRKGKTSRELVGAGLVIDCGLGLKGKARGGAKISLEHANHIVNTGRATADDVRFLINLIKETAKSVLNLELEEEIKYLGF